MKLTIKKENILLLEPQKIVISSAAMSSPELPKNNGDSMEIDFIDKEYSIAFTENGMLISILGKTAYLDLSEEIQEAIDALEIKPESKK